MMVTQTRTQEENEGRITIAIFVILSCILGIVLTLSMEVNGVSLWRLLFK